MTPDTQILNPSKTATQTQIRVTPETRSWIKPVLGLLLLAVIGTSAWILLVPRDEDVVLREVEFASGFKVVVTQPKDSKAQCYDIKFESGATKSRCVDRETLGLEGQLVSQDFAAQVAKRPAS